MTFIKIYHGYGSTNNVVVYAHVFNKEPPQFKEERAGILSNMASLIALFKVDTFAAAEIVVELNGQQTRGTAQHDGFIKVEFAPPKELPTGWHSVYMWLENEPENRFEGKVYLPHQVPFAFISDIDDTIMRSYSATILKRLYELLSRHPSKRRLFKNTSIFYQALARPDELSKEPNPFFYVSSSEWNLYDYLKTVFREHKLPEGVFLLNSIKKWYDFFKSGKTGHDGKLIRIVRLLNSFPEQKFVLMGDNSQQDPAIYSTLAERHKHQIGGIIIRNVRKDKASFTRHMLEKIDALGVPATLIDSTQEAIAFAKTVGFITPTPQRWIYHYNPLLSIAKILSSSKISFRKDIQ